MITEKWEAMPMLGSPLWGVKDDKGTIIVLGLTEELARLIAAAPELLTAIEAMFKECSMIHKYGGEGCNSKQADAAVRAGREAIAKAKAGA